MRKDAAVRNPVLWLGVATLVLDAVVLLDGLGPSRLGIDFDVFRRASVAPAGHVYPGFPAQPFVNPPPALFLIRPLAWLAPWPGFLGWTLLNVSVFFVGMWRLFGARPAWAALVSPVLLWACWLGQATPLLSGLAAFGIGGPPLWGLLLGAVVVIKPQMLWLVPIALALRREHVRLAWTMAGAVVATGLSVVVFGANSWRDWTASLPAFRHAVLDQSITAYSASLSGLAQPLGPFAASAAMVFAIALSGLALRKVAPTAATPQFYAGAIAASAFCAPYAMPHDLVGALPAAFVAVLSGAGWPVLVAGMSIYLGLTPALGIALAMVFIIIRLSRTSTSNHPNEVWDAAPPR